MGKKANKAAKDLEARTVSVKGGQIVYNGHAGLGANVRGAAAPVRLTGALDVAAIEAPS